MAATGDLDVTSKITFTGMGAQATVIDGGGLDRVLDLRWDSTPYLNPIEISGLTIQGGDAGAAEGGGIRSVSGLRLRNVAILNNRAQTGGGIYIQPSMSIHPLGLTTTLVHGNSAVQRGGGVHCRFAELTMYRSGVTGNAAFVWILIGGRKCAFGLEQWLDAIQRAGSAEGKALQKALAATKGYKAVTGEITYSRPSGVPVKGVSIISVQGGKYKVEEVWSPKN